MDDELPIRSMERSLDRAAARIAALERDLAEARSEVARLERENDRLRRDRYDALSVTSRDGLLSSEWVARTGKAERELAEARRERDELRESYDKAERLIGELRAKVWKYSDALLRVREEVRTTHPAFRIAMDALYPGTSATEALSDD